MSDRPAERPQPPEAPPPPESTDAPDPTPPNDSADVPAPTDAPEPAEPPASAETPGPQESKHPDEAPDPDAAPEPSEADEPAGSVTPEADEAPAPVPGAEEDPDSAPEPGPPHDAAEISAEPSDRNGPDSDAAPVPTEVSTGAADAAPCPEEAAEPSDAPQVSDADEAPAPAPVSDAAPDQPEAAGEPDRWTRADVPDAIPEPSEADEPAGSVTPEADEAPAPVPGAEEDPDSAPEPGPPHDAPETPAEPSGLGEVSEAPGRGETPAPDDATPSAPDDGSARHDRADVDEDAVEGGVLDRLKRLAGKTRQETDGIERLTGTVDHPDFQDVTCAPADVPDRYGSPLDHADGTRTPLFDGDPSREQTEQGGLGDCGIIATLGAVAACHPEAIRECVRETEDGNYAVKLHEAKFNYSRDRYEPTGRDINLTVTPDLPVFDARPDEPAFADSVATGTAWAPVLEKAIAGSDQAWDTERRDRWAAKHRMLGAPEVPEGYVRLNQGSTPSDRAELLTQLTGRPATTVDFPRQYDHDGRSPDKQLMGDLRQQLAEGKPVLVGTHTEKEIGGPLSNDLHPAHAYEVTRVDDRGRIHLRNPWNALHPEPLTLQQFKKNIRPRYTTLE